MGEVKAFLVCLLLCSAWARLTLQPISSDSRAVCMDGSPGMYYWRPSLSPALENTWLVFLQPGGQCWDQATCDARWLMHKSNKNRKESIRLAGIFAMAGDGFDLNQVYVPYCTSDGHMGDGTAFGYQFRGARIVQAVIKDLIVHRGLGGGSSKHTLIFGGASAGARGAMVHLDYMPSYLGDVASNVEMKGFLDSPLYLDLPARFNAQATAFWQQSKNIYEAMNVTRLGESCHAEYMTEPWKCLMGQYRMPHVKTNYFLVAAQFDGYQLGTEGIPSSGLTREQTNFAMLFAGGTRASGQNLVHGGNAVFSSACYNHAVSLSDRGFKRHTSSRRRTTMQSAFQLFLGLDKLEPEQRLAWIELCVDFDCGAGCHALGTLGEEEWAERPDQLENGAPLFP